MSCLGALLGCAAPQAVAPVACCALDTCNREDFDVPPKLIQAPEPLYPQSRRKLDEQGTVIARFTVTREGTTGNIETNLREHDSFSRAATDAIKEWRFEPALKGGAPVATTCMMTFRFRLRN